MQIETNAQVNENLNDRKELWCFYEKAIEGRNSFYEHYVRYMNLYAIFTGAFFIAFYNVFDSTEEIGQLFGFLICMMGMATSSLWLCSVKGYYAWIINWIIVVKHYEELLNEGRKIGDSRFVYGLFYNAQSNCSLLSPSRFSTQKLTMAFVLFTILGWICAFVTMISQFLYSKGLICSCIKNGIIWVPFLATFIFFLYVICKSFGTDLKDDVESHYRLKCEECSEEGCVEKSFSIHPPKNKGE